MTGRQLVDIGGAEVSRTDAFCILAERRLEASYRLARAILHDPAEAEDATHDAILNAWRKWPSLRDPTKFDRWFDRILVNGCRNRLRRLARQGPAIADDLPGGVDDPSRALGEREAIRSALATLSPDHRLVIALRFYRDLTVPEIADLVGARQGTIKSRLHHALRRLAVLLDEADAEVQP